MKANIEIEEIEKMYNGCRYVEIVEQVYIKYANYFVHSKLPIYTNPYEMCELKMFITYGIISSYELKAFCDCLKICRLFFSVFEINFLKQDTNFNCYLERYMHSLLYYLIRTNDCVDGEIDKVIRESKGNQSGFMGELIDMYKYISDGNKIYSMYTFSLPYMLPVQDGLYSAGCINGVENIEVIAIKDDDITSIHGLRWFSKIKIKSEKFVSNDIYWMGDSIDTRRYVNIEFITKTINEFVLYLRSIADSQYLSRLSFKQLSNIEITTENYDFDKLFSTINFGFGGHAMVDIIGPAGILISQENHSSFREILKIGFEFKVAEKLLMQALLCLDDELYVETFYAINSSMESFISDFTRKVSVKHSDNYNEFTSPNSACERCVDYKSGKMIAPKLPPSIFKYASFLKEIDVINSNEEKKIKELISRVKMEEYRNKLMHGEIADIEKTIVLKSLSALKELKQLLNDLLINL